MLKLMKITALLSTMLLVGCATGPSGKSFDSPVGEWSERYEKKNGGFGTTRVTVIDETKATYAHPANGRIEFHTIDEQRRWKGYWILQNGANACSEDKGGSPYWGEVIFQFNDTYNQYEGSWDVCGGGPKYATRGVR